MNDMNRFDIHREDYDTDGCLILDYNPTGEYVMAEDAIKLQADVERLKYPDNCAIEIDGKGYYIEPAAYRKIKSLQAEVDELKTDLHYCNGVSDLAMKHRDIAEAEVERLKEELAYAYKGATMRGRR